MAAFEVTPNNVDTTCKGFCLTFANGYGLSVQWGRGNYGDNRDAQWGDEERTSDTAEIAVVLPNGDLDHDSVTGYLSADEVAEWIIEVSTR